ncbi:MAG: HVO_0476 family zinc finger protein [Halobacteriota archaeon]
MSDTGERVAVVCPACSPDRTTVHEVLSDGGEPTLRCLTCRHVHRGTVDPTPSTRPVRTIVSQGGESITTTVSLPRDDTLALGQEFVVETDEAVFSVEVTAIEARDGTRPDRLTVEETATLWTRDIGNVAVPVTIHPPERSDRASRSTTMHVPGDRTFEVGTNEEVDGEPTRVAGILLRDPEARQRKLNDRGDVAEARAIDRLYVRSRRRVSTSPW